MGKRVKPKGRNPRKQLRSQGSDLDPPQNPSDPKPDTTNEEEEEEEETTTKTKEGCGHYTKGDSHLNKILLSILSSTSDFSSCDHCRDESPQVSRKGGKKKKRGGGGGSGSRGGEAKPNPDPIWVCLDCGRSFCGGAVEKEVPYGHARRHNKQEKHNWAVGPASVGTAWCFLCDAEVPIEMPSIEETAISTPKPTSEPDYTKAIKSDSKTESSSFHGGPHRHIIRGLSNLGNTCFFNSVLQNLLSLQTLRESLLTPPNSDIENRATVVAGPLTMSLRKLFLETNGGEDCKGVLSPKNLFGNICSKAPQFRGYQQQDSHELLRYLLDGLNTEETSARKSELADSDEAGPTLVGSIFSGRLSSTVSCLECGYTSVVHEPFLDLSLPVPAKKTSAVTGAKKGGNRAPLVRGRGRSHRPRSSLADEKKTKKLDASCLKEEGATKSGGSKTEGTVSEAGETAVDSSEGVAVSKEEVGASGSGVGPENAADDVADYCWMDFVADVAQEPSEEEPTGLVVVGTENTAGDVADFCWMDFLVDQETADVAQELPDEEPTGLEVAGTESTAPAPKEQPGSTIIEAGAANLKECTVSKADVMVAVTETFCWLGYDDPECKMMSSESTLHELEPVRREVTVSEGTAVGADPAGPTSTVFEVVVDSGKELTGSSSSVISDEREGTLEAKIPELLNDNNRLPDESDEPDNMVSEAKVAHDRSAKLKSAVSDANVAQDRSDKLKSAVSDANVAQDRSDKLKSAVSDAKVDDAEASSSSFESDKLNGTVQKANARDDVDWLMDEETAESTTTQENTKTETDTNTNTSTEIILHPSKEEANGGDTSFSTVNEEREEVQQEVEFDGFGDMFNEPEEEPIIGPVNRPGSTKPEEEDDSDSIFWGSGVTYSGLSSNSEEVDDSDKPVSVLSCLELFTKPELLTGEHAWHCDKCSAELRSGAIEQDCGKKDKKVMRDAMKRYLVDRAPRVLTVHLKRFGQDARGRLSKLRGHVNFEELLDLTPYIINGRSNDKDKCTYQLVGLVEHSGSMSGGHYVAYVRGEKTLKGGVHGLTWFYASDAHVKEVTLSEVLRSEAYLLFYEKVENENSSSSSS